MLRKTQLDISQYRTFPLWVRSLVVLGLLFMQVPLSVIIGPQQVYASAYNCYGFGNHCYGMNTWLGPTWGSQTYIWVNTILCSICNPNTAYALNEEMWLADVGSGHSGGYIEVGYTTSWTHYGSRYYFYANTVPPGNPDDQSYVEIMPVPSGDYSHYSGFKLTRNGQAANKVVLQIWSASNPRLFGTVLTNSMGGGYGTPNAYLGVRVDAGSEVRGVSGGSVVQSSNGAIRLANNQWQYNNGTYHYQTANGSITHNLPEQATWDVLPSSSSTGGVLNVSCGC